MNIEELRGKLIKLTKEEASVVVYFVFNIGDEISVRVVDIEDKFLNELKVYYNSFIETTIISPPSEEMDLSIINLTSADSRANALYYYDLDSVPIGLSFFEIIAKKTEQLRYSSDVDDLKNLFGYVVSIGVEKEKIMFFKKHAAINTFSPQKFFIFEAKKRFTKLTSTMLRIDPNFEILYSDGAILVKKLETLERYLGYHDILKKEASKGIGAIDSANIIDNLDKLKSMVDDVSFARKIIKATKNSPVLGMVPVSTIIKFVEKFPSLKGTMKLSSDKSRLHLTTKKSVTQFIKLLNDDFLQSELTKAYYDSMAKDAIATEKKKVN